MTEAEFQNIEIHGGVPTITDANPDGIWTLYEGPKKCECHTNWVTEMPADVRLQLDKKDEEIEAGTYAIIVRKKRNNHDDLFPKVHVHSVAIQSKLLKKALKKLFMNYGGISLDPDTPVLTAPFIPFFHYWNRWQEHLESEEDGRMKSHMRLLDSVLRDELAPAFEAKRRALEEGVVGFEHLWAIFSPNQTVYHHDGRYDRLYRILSIKEFPLDKLEISVRYTEYDGQSFVKGYRKFTLYHFEGSKKIKDLTVYPLDCCPDAQKLQEDLFKRGEKVLQYAGVHCLDYCGSADSGLADGYQSAASISHTGRIIVDTDSFRKNSSAEHLNDLSKYAKLDDDQVCSASAGDQQFTHDTVCRLTPYLRGWSLARNQWLSFGVENVSAPVWKTEAFSKLSLPDDFRELIQATVEMQLKRESVFDDLIPGKGQGFVMLLSGAPGVGKTATVETIAEALRLPLYVLSAANLGTKAGEIESKLQAEFAQARRWRAILLLDEADIFLERRSSVSDVRRNAIVAVFLRLLEYNAGLLCLTTNRPGCIDPAVQSRVHLSLRYPDLAVEAREKIWRQFAAAAAKARVEAQRRKEEEEEEAEENLTLESMSISVCTKGPESDEDLPELVASEKSDEDDDDDDDDGDDEEQRARHSADGADDGEAKEDAEEVQGEDERYTDPQLDITDEEFAELARFELDGRQIKNVFKTATLLAEWKGNPLDFASLKRSLQIVERHMNQAT